MLVQKSDEGIKIKINVYLRLSLGFGNDRLAIACFGTWLRLEQIWNFSVDWKSVASDVILKPDPTHLTHHTVYILPLLRMGSSASRTRNHHKEL
jgi:hypothetical protein